MSKLEARFRAHMNTGDPASCWVWQGASNGRYGRWNGRAAHRMVYEREVGPVPKGLVLRHTCDTPLCVNPAHLEPGTQLQNLGDAVARARTATGERNGRTTISADQAVYIRRNPDSLSAAALGARFGISKTAAYYIRSGRSWKGGGR